VRRLAWWRLLPGIFLLICLTHPVVGTFDTWDDTLRDGNDAEANVTILILMVGMALLAAVAIVARFRPPRVASTARSGPHL
jgi:succinate dehydrogenase hydrophobic anchor subunit